MKINAKIIAAALAASQLLFSNQIFGNSWSTGAQIPFGSSTGLFGRFEACVYDPATGQIIQTWQDLGTASHFLYSSSFNGETWTTLPIPSGTSIGTSQTNEFYSPMYNPGMGQMVQIWQDTANAPHGVIYTSSFNGTSWSTGVPVPLGSSTGVADFSNPIYYPPSNQLVEIWLDSGNSFLYYSTNNGSGWTQGVQIPPGASTGISYLVLPFYVPSTGQLVQFWKDSTSEFLYYSVYNGLSWTVAQEIPPGASGMVTSFNSPTYFPATGQLVQVWQDATGFFYSVYNGKTWSTGAKIPPGSSTGGVGFPPYPISVPSTRQLVLLWIDAGVGNLPYYSVYDGASWTTAAKIPLGASTQVGGISGTYNPATGQFVAAWADTGTALLYYTVFDGTKWTTAAAIPMGTSTGVTANYIPFYDASSGQMVQVWEDSGAGHFMYSSTYNGTSWTTGVEIQPGTSSGVTGFNPPVGVPSTDQLMLIWRNSVGPSFYLYYSTYQ